MSSGEGTVAVPSNILPAVANIVPSNSPGSSQLLPLYHARGYYGPTPNEIEEVDYDAEPVEYGPSLYQPSLTHSGHAPKRLKIIKLNEPPHKKVVRKGKPKRVVVRKPQSHSSIEGELPVTTFHEQFYSDVDGSGTVRKVKKPPRIEKIVDGDTEHIHTYSEEHIHKLFYDQGAKVAGVVGVNPLTGMSSIASPQHIIPFKGGTTLVALPSHQFAGLAAVGGVANTNNFEYAAYNPRDVTHDHIFHDHGEIPTELELNKESLALPPKVSYNSQGLRISGTQKKYKNKNSQKVKKLAKPVPTDFSYYESIYTPNSRPRKIPRPTVPTYDTTGEAVLDDYRPIPNFGYKEIHKKPRNQLPSYYGKSNDFHSEQASVPTPFEISNTVLHEYKPKRYQGAGSSPESLTKFRDPFANFKDTYTNNFEYDTYASSSNTYRSEDKNDSGYDHHGKNGKKKSISTQNISFGGQDQITWNVDHTADAGNIDDDNVPTALDMDQFDQDQSNSVQKDPAQIEQFFSLLAGRDLNADQITMPDASNNNYQYAEAPTVPTTAHASATTVPNFKMESTEAPPNESARTTEARKSRRNNETEPKNKDHNRSRSSQNQSSSRSHEQDNTVGKLKYGDKI
ncbi:jg6488 [Pararge aegeria aegeria]|uniref:Jg6488 protein n=1 Tax=Pararge aegeria aegeria TaxID=348720 RepID=A0A8S4QGU1_9NEOP|nr:jg6488 [Pararge aegeria aegeria]